MPWAKWAITFLILLWLGWQSATPVDFVRSDLGRHIKNGELILRGTSDVLYKNFYSYTYPEYPFINTHWLFGVFCYVLWHQGGITGLAIIYLMLELLAFFLFFCCCQRYSSFLTACAFGLLSFPLICCRYEIRPEGISYLFCGLFWLLIDSYQHKRLKSVFLSIILTVLQIIWVNTHIFFMMGPLLTALFWVQAKLDDQKEQLNVLQKLFFLLLAACLVNPFGMNIWQAMLDNWGKTSSFPITESLSLLYSLQSKIFPNKPLLYYFIAAFVFLSTGLFFLIRRDGLKKYFFIIILTLLLALASIKVIRMIGLFGYFWAPLSAYVYSQWIGPRAAYIRKATGIALVVLGFLASAFANAGGDQKHMLGIVPGANGPAEFFKQAKISGPIFNNYSIGGYLIFHLSPQYKLFVDNRGATAFPDEFFNKEVNPMQLNENIWHKMDGKYHFNAIFYTPDVSDRFFVNRLMDPEWALVFQRGEASIFLKCNAQNQKLFAQPLCPGRE